MRPSTACRIVRRRKGALSGTKGSDRLTRGSTLFDVFTGLSKRHAGIRGNETACTRLSRGVESSRG